MSLKKLAKENPEKVKEIAKNPKKIFKTATQFYNSLCTACKTKIFIAAQRGKTVDISEYCEDCQEKARSLN